MAPRRCFGWTECHVANAILGELYSLGSDEDEDVLIGADLGDAIDKWEAIRNEESARENAAWSVTCEGGL